ncbi:MAG: response regulator transcription factor [Cyclobacteriaceae bacterium]|nr:response regulator transcription factor [Cyclobacteriaceae bacterium]
MKILVVEDEPKVANFIKAGLEENGYEVDVAFDGQLGEKLSLSRNYGLVILDIIVPFVNGLELCKRIRKEKTSLPILMLTALGTTEDKVTGLEAGADDYLLKPFDFQELLARVRALIRRSEKKAVDSTTILKIANLELDLDKKLAIRDATKIALTAKEFLLLEYFMKNKGRVLSRSELAEKIWDVTFDTGTNVVEVYINILRKKIDKDFEPKLIHTRIGLGYIMSEEL